MPQNGKPITYAERVLPGLWFFAATLVVPLTLFLIGLPFGEMIAFASSLISIAFIWLITWLFALKIEISEESVRVGKAKIERTYLGRAEVISGSDVLTSRGRDLSPASYAKFVPAVKGLVRIAVVDPNDPTPTWIFSTRNPEIIAAILNKAS